MKTVTDNKKRKKSKNKKNKKKIQRDFLYGNSVAILQIVIASIQLALLFSGIYSNHKMQKETAIDFKIDSAQLNISLSNKNLQKTKLAILYLDAHNEVMRYKCNTANLIEITEYVNERSQKILNNNKSKIGEHFWCPIILDVEYQNNTKIVRRKYLYKLVYTLTETTPNTHIVNPNLQWTEYTNIYNGNGFVFIKQLPMYADERKNLIRYYEKAENEFKNELISRKEINDLLKQRKTRIVAILNEKSNGEVDYYEAKTR